MRGEYGLMVDADAATDIEDLDRLLIRMRDVESMGTELQEMPLTGERERDREGNRGGSTTTPKRKHGMVVGSRAHMEGEAVAKVLTPYAVIGGFSLRSIGRLLDLGSPCLAGRGRRHCPIRIRAPMYSIVLSVLCVVNNMI